MFGRRRERFEGLLNVKEKRRNLLFLKVFENVKLASSRRSTFLTSGDEIFAIPAWRLSLVVSPAKYLLIR